MHRISTAVIGVGALGRHHLRWLSQIPESELVGIYDTNIERAETYAREYNVRAFSSLDEVATSVKAVSIATPTSVHFETASFLLDCGIHCLIEKPITATLDEASRLRELARQRGCKVTVGQIERFNPAVRALSQYEIKPSFIEAHRLAAFDPRGTDVAVVLDLMIHDIDLVLMLMRQPIIDIHASAVAVISEQVDIANARLTFANGAAANLTASRISLRAMRKLRIFQKSGYFSLDLAEKQADVYRLADDSSPSEGMRVPLGKSGKEILYVKKGDNGQDMLGLELQTFLQSILEDRPMAVPLDDAIEALRVALEIERVGRESTAAMLRV